jgi:hypothetical protein
MATGKTDIQILKVLSEVKHWENMPNCGEPLTVDMIADQQLLCQSQPKYATLAAMYDLYNWFVFGSMLEITSPNGHNGMVLILSTTLMVHPCKAFTTCDVSFFGVNHCQL